MEGPSRRESSRETGSLSSRCRRQTVFYEPDQPSQKKAFRVEKGDGVQLRNITSVWTRISGLKADEPFLTDLHRILFKRTGTKMRRKRDIGDFSGFVFAKGEKKSESENLKERLSSVKNLKQLAELFDLPQKGEKNKVIHSIAEFLIKPVDTSQSPPPPTRNPTPKKKTVKKVIVPKKRKKEGAAKTESAKKKAKTVSKKKAEKQEEEEPEETGDAAEEDSGDKEAEGENREVEEKSSVKEEEEIPVDGETKVEDQS